MSISPLVILGTGGFAREVRSWVPRGTQVKAFFNSDVKNVGDLMGSPIVHRLEAMKGCCFLVAATDPAERRNLWNAAKCAGLEPSDPLIHPLASIGRDCDIGAGSIIGPGVVITANVATGRGLIAHMGATIGYDSALGEFVTLAPGARVSSRCVIGNGAYVGMGACVSDSVIVGATALIAMGTVVLANVPPGRTWIGNPGRELKK